MEYVFSIVTAVFSGALLMYAGLMALTKDYKMLPIRSRQSVKPKDPKKYTLQLAKVVALVAVAPALAAVVVLIVGIGLFIWLGTLLMKKVR